MRKFVALYDLHFGYERDQHRHKKALHDPKAMNIALEFLCHFKPDVIILGGDILDCGAISHHNRHRPGRTEGLRLLADAQDLRAEFLSAVESHAKANLVYLTGNHEAWLDQLTDEMPGLEGVVSLRPLLGLGDRWTVIPRGGYHNLGKLTFIHGDQIAGGEYAAKKAVLAYERSVRMGHYHTFQVYTKTSALDIKLGRTGVLVPCLCTKDPKYGEGAPNRWVQGFNYGWVERDGHYADYFPLIVNGKAIIEGKVFKG